MTPLHEGVSLKRLHGGAPKSVPDFDPSVADVVRETPSWRGVDATNLKIVKESLWHKYRKM